MLTFIAGKGCMVTVVGLSYCAERNRTSRRAAHFTGADGRDKERLDNSKFPCKCIWVLRFLLCVESSQATSALPYISESYCSSNVHDWGAWSRWAAWSPLPCFRTAE